jgi:NTE family protein
MLQGPAAATTSGSCERKLVLVATDLDSGQTAPFGQPGWDHVPISQAMAASAALPGCFRRCPSTAAGTWTAR